MQTDDLTLQPPTPPLPPPHTHTHIHTPSHPRSEPCPFSLGSLHVSQVLKEIDSEGISAGTLNIS